MDKIMKEFEQVLEKQNGFLDAMTQKQKLLRQSIREKNWEKLVELIKEITLISDAFSEVDIKRDQIQKTLTPEQVKPYLPMLRTLRAKLMSCKVENKVLGDYVKIARQFIQEVVDEALPVRGNKNYSKTGKMTQPQLQSVLVDLRG